MAEKRRVTGKSLARGLGRTREHEEEGLKRPTLQRFARLVLIIAACAAVLGMPDARAATGLAFLKNGADARAELLGQAVTSVVGDASASYWNPAGLALLSQPQLLLCHVESFADLRQEFGVITQPLGSMTAALSFNGMWAEDMEGYDGSANPTGTLSWSSYEAAVALGQRVSTQLALGASIGYLRESIGQYGASGWSLGAGAQWAPLRTPALRLGLAVRNIGPSMKFIDDEFRQPLTVQGGASWLFRPGQAASALLVSADVRFVRDEDAALLLGAEYGFQDLLSLGVGVRTGHDTRDMTVGIGAHPGRWGLYWAYAPIAEDLGDEHRLSVRLDL